MTLNYVNTNFKNSKIFFKIQKEFVTQCDFLKKIGGFTYVKKIKIYLGAAHE